MIATIREIVMAVLLVMLASPAHAAFNLELTPRPDPPETGDNVMTIKITNDAGKPLDDAKIDMLPFMPAMGTMPRMEEKTAIKPLGGGVYEASFDLPMGGTWEIALKVEHGGAAETSHHSITTGIPGVQSRSSRKPSAAGGVSGGTADVLDLGPDRLQKIGVRFFEAKIAPLRKAVEAVGVVEQDQTHREEVTLRFSGYVAKQFRGRVGDAVKAGEALFSVYSPDLVAAQSELLLANKIGVSVHEAAAGKLKNLGMSERDIQQIRKSGQPTRELIVRAPSSGTILEVVAREGAAVSAGQVVYVIGDLSKNYLVARVFQQDVSALRVGQTVEVSLPGGSKSVTGRLGLIYPQVEPGAGTTNVRVETEAHEAALRPGAYARLTFPVDLGSSLLVPQEAVLYSGKHRYVFVDRGEGILEPREVEVGAGGDGHVVVTSGLEAGERVAASGTFLIGSEAQLRSALPKWKSKR